MLTFERRAWSVPNEERAFTASLEGPPSPSQREVIVARTRSERANWRPNADAWTQFIRVNDFVGCRIRIQFWDDGSMWLLAENEWPDKVDGTCHGVATLLDEGLLQAYLILHAPVSASTRQPSTSSYLQYRDRMNSALAPLADIYWVELLPANCYR
jgi:hypothetical protein